jgi:hypothetical protein
LRSVLTLSLATSALGCLLALLGRAAVLPGIDPWPRFWATCFFILLIWPVSLSLLGHLLGIRAQLLAAAALLALIVAQQRGQGLLPLPLVVRYPVTLSQPGAAIRRQIQLPAPDAPDWRRAWDRASQVVLAICSEAAVPLEAEVRVSINGGQAIPLADTPRVGKAEGSGWYYLPVSRLTIDPQRPLDVVIRRERATGGPAILCGGQDDPTRPGYGGSWRWRNGQWSTEALGDVPVPAQRGVIPPQRYYVELRFLDADGLPHVAIWY